MKFDNQSWLKITKFVNWEGKKNAHSVIKKYCVIYQLLVWKKKIKNHLASTHTHTEKKILRVARTDPKTHHAANCVKNLEICRLAARKYREIHQMVDGNITKNNTGKYHKILNKTVLNVFFLTGHYCPLWEQCTLLSLNSCLATLVFYGSTLKLFPTPLKYKQWHSIFSHLKNV